MPLDVVDPVLEVPVALGEVDLQEVAEEVLQVGAEVRREADLQRNQQNFITKPFSLFYLIFKEK